MKSDKILERAEKEGTPLIDGNTVTFVWQGNNPPKLMGDFTDWQRKPSLDLTEIAPQVWTYSREFASDAYLEYAFFGEDKRLPDPFNKRRLPNGIGDYNHFFAMPDYLPNPLIKLQKGVTAGKITTITTTKAEDISQKNRQVFLYQPPVSEPVPLLFVLDGKDYYRRAKITTIVDNLIAQKRISPIAMVMVDNGGANRFIEYFCSEATLAYQIWAITDLVKEQLNLLDIAKNPGAYGILGASMGGLMSLYTGMRMPEVFGKVIAQSGAFEFTFNGRKSVIFDLVQDKPRQPLNIFMDVGKYEWLLEPNREMKQLLDEKGYSPTYREYSAGHNYTAWRDELISGLETVFGL
jgi:enterochelin esterase-like enzyme